MSTHQPELFPLDGQDARVLYLPPEQWIEPFTLRGDEAHHAVRVLRLRVGDEVRLLDGQGREGVFRFTGVSGSRNRQDLALEPLRLWMHPPRERKVVLAAGWTKAARRGWILEKSVEFEAAAIWMWQADRSQFPVPDDISAAWHGQLVAGAKQCHNPWLPELRTQPGGVDELIAASASFEHRYVLLESDHSPSMLLCPEQLALPGTSIFVVGPEGGLSVQEVRALGDAGFTGVSLGERVLRWETAALLCLGLHWWKGGMPA